MPQYQGVWTVEQQAQALTNQQWVTDPNFKNTTLLLQADGVGSGSQNQSFLDSSTNNFFITRNGNTTQGSFSPFSQAPGYWSNYFNGSSTISMASNSAFNILAYDTFECWVNFSALGTSNLIAGRDSNYWLAYNHTGINGAANKIVFSIYNGGSWQAVSSTTTPTVGVWYHILGVKDNTTLRIYINGVQENTATFSGSPGTTGTFYIASNNNGENTTGYISNLRLITGASNAVFPYSGLTTGAAFTPQTTPLTAVSSTQLLTCQSNRFVDNSTNAFALTAVSVPSVQAFGPFAPALQWTPDVIAGSGYFDGSGDYLTTPTSSAFSLTGDFTYEAWVYCTSTSTNRFIMPSSVTMVLDIVPATGNNMKLQFFDGSATADAINTFPINAWAHVALVRSGSGSNNCAFYVNGVRGTQFTSSATNSSPSITIGNYSTQYYYGYIGTFRIVNGQAVYSGATYTVPNAPLTTTGYGTTSQSITASNTKLLLNYTNAGIYDGKMANNLETVGSAQVATSPVKYGSGSMYFNGSTSYLTRPYSPLFAFGNGNFTVECWINTTQNGGANYPSVVGRWSGGNSWDLRHSAGDNSGKPTFAYNDGTSNFNVASTGSTVYDGQWHHLAAVRNNNIITLYVDGISVGTSTFTGTIAAATSTPLTVGSTSGGGIYYTGYIDDLRITVGVARYFTNFTPPQQALPRQ